MGCSVNPIDPGSCFLTGGAPAGCLFCVGAAMQVMAPPSGEAPAHLPRPVNTPRQFLEQIKRHHRLVPVTWLIVPVAIGVLIALIF